MIEGKHDEAGAPLLPSHGNLSSNQIALAIACRLLERVDDGELRAGSRRWSGRSAPPPATSRRCCGCPISAPAARTAARPVPEGSKALAGIGCHFMVQWMDRDTRALHPDGRRGRLLARRGAVQHAGAHLPERRRRTFYHSGSLAVRAAVASGANITFKILYNDAVAMTGGQKMETGNLDVPAITRLLESEGVKEIAVVTDEPARAGRRLGAGRAGAPPRRAGRGAAPPARGAGRLRPGLRPDLRRREAPAPQARRLPRPGRARGDQRAGLRRLRRLRLASNCVAIQPQETELGRKRRIDQSACNKDFSCLKGFCFVTVKGGRLRKAAASTQALPFPVLPEPELPALDGPYGIVVTGVGGTGVVTVAACSAWRRTWKARASPRST